MNVLQAEEIPTLMLLNDFSALIQFAATLNIAFVAVEFAKSYAHTLSKQIFKFDEYIKNSLKKGRDLLIERDTLKTLIPVVIDGKSTLNEIERVKRNLEEIPDDSEKLNADVLMMCESKSVSSLSLWFFLFNVLALVLCGLKSIDPHRYFLYFWLYMSGLSVIYTALGYILGEKKQPLKYFDCSILKQCILYFSVSMFLSGSLVFIFQRCAGYCFNNQTIIISVILSVLLPWFNFIGYLIFVALKVKRIFRHIRTVSDQFETECKKINRDINELMAVGNLSKKINFNESCEE
jgi:hypothetical protein